MESTIIATPRTRPGGRAAEVTAKVKDAVLGLLVDGGLEACTFQNVAARAGIQRSTLYRRYPDRWRMLIDTIIEVAESEVTANRGVSFVDDLTELLRRFAAIFSTSLGPAVITVAAAVRSIDDPEISSRFWTARRKQLEPMYDAAIARGELAADVDRDELFALAAGPIYFRLFIAQQSVDPAFIATIVDAICDRYCRRQ